jgi:hypothetical protein
VRYETYGHHIGEEQDVQQIFQVRTSIITKYNVCSLACKAYLLALSPGNLQSSFKRTGIYPYNPDVIDRSNVVPSQVFKVAIATSVLLYHSLL